MQQQVYNTTSERQANSKRHDKRHSKFIRYSVNNTLLIILKNTMSLPERFFGSTFSFFSFKGFSVSVSSLGGNCQASGEVPVIASLGPLAKNGRGVATLGRAAKGRERCGDRYLPRPLADTTLPIRIPSGLLFNSLRFTGPAYWKHIVIKTNN